MNRMLVLFPRCPTPSFDKEGPLRMLFLPPFDLLNRFSGVPSSPQVRRLTLGFSPSSSSEMFRLYQVPVSSFWASSFLILHTLFTVPFFVPYSSFQPFEPGVVARLETFFSRVTAVTTQRVFLLSPHVKISLRYIGSSQKSGFLGPPHTF